MAEPRSRPSSVLLEPPPKGVELEDPGASDHSMYAGQVNI